MPFAFPIEPRKKGCASVRNISNGMMDSRFLARLYQSAHSEMRNIDGLQPQDAFDELLKYVFFKERDEVSTSPVILLDGMASSEDVQHAVLAIRGRFDEFVRDAESTPARWDADKIALSDRALVKVHALFQSFKLTSLDLDLRSAALREFLSGPIRKSLGIFLTPDSVVREVVNALAPRSGQRILDPACGAGTFLMDTAAYVAARGGEAQVFGIDKNARMVQLAEFNCGHVKSLTFRRSVSDSLTAIDGTRHPEWFRYNSFDVIVTNPPFGVTIDAMDDDFGPYMSLESTTKRASNKQGSEVMFLERCLKLLAPGGWLGIVLPRSVVTNKRVTSVRQNLSAFGAIRAVITLPSETFAATGTQTTTVVLFIQRYGPGFSEDDIVSPAIARLENVGFDSTGRSRPDSQLPGLGAEIRAAMVDGMASARVRLIPEVVASSTFKELHNYIGEQRTDAAGDEYPIGDLIELASTGATPARSAYSNSGMFLVKVGNLTGSGMNWLARERNFILDASARRYLSQERQLVEGDILLTSSAHAARYICKKVDIITSVPEDVGGRASFTGEVMLVRPKKGIDPFRLLAYLRLPTTALALQDRVRGQTAHLHPQDLLELPVSSAVFESPTLVAIADLLREEARLNDALNAVAYRQLRLQEELGQANLLQVAE